MENTAASAKSINDEIIDSLIKKVNELDKKDIHIPDYTPNFKALTQWLEDHRPGYNKPIDELKIIVKQHNMEYPATRIQNHIDEVKTIVDRIPKDIPVNHYHYFDYKSKGWVIAGISLLIVTAISAGLCGHLLVSNNRLSDNDIKFRLLRQVYPVNANWAEQTYYKYPKEVKADVKKMETEAMERSAAQDRVNEAEREVQEAKRQLHFPKKINNFRVHIL